MGIFSSNGNEIKIAPEVKSDPNAYECLRIWMNQGAPEIFAEAIRETADPGAWGSVLADATALVSSQNATTDSERKEAMKRIQSIFNSLIDGWVK